MNQSNRPIHEEVRDHYARAALDVLDESDVVLLADRRAAAVATRAAER